MCGNGPGGHTWGRFDFFFSGINLKVVDQILGACDMISIMACLN